MWSCPGSVFTTPTRLSIRRRSQLWEWLQLSKWESSDGETLQVRPVPHAQCCEGKVSLAHPQWFVFSSATLMCHHSKYQPNFLPEVKFSQSRSLFWILQIYREVKRFSLRHPVGLFIHSFVHSFVRSFIKQRLCLRKWAGFWDTEFKKTLHFPGVHSLIMGKR